MTRKEAAIMGAFTGILCGPFSDMHKYVEDIMERPVFTHEMGHGGIAEEIKERSREDFLKIVNNLTD